MISGKIWVLATACVAGLQTGIICTWARGLFAQIADGKTQIVLSPHDEIHILNSMNVFRIVGSVLASYLMEKRGRKAALIALSILSLFGWVPSLIGSTVVWFCVAQAFHGVFTNAFVTVMPILIGETMETDIRGSVNTLSCVTMLSGPIVTSALSATNYIVYVSAPLIPAVATFAMAFMLKETPYFNLMKHGREKARKSFVWLRGYCDEEDLSKIERRIHLRNAGSWGFKGFKEFLKRNIRKPLGSIILFAFLSKGSGYDTFDSLVSFILPKSSISSTAAVSIVSVTSLAGAFVAMFLVDRIGRRPLSFVSYLGSSVSFLSVSVWYYLYEFTLFNIESTRWLPLAVFSSVGLFSNLRIQQMPSSLLGELFSFDSIERASMTVTIVTAASLALFNEAFYLMKQVFGMAITMIVCTVFNSIGCICVCAVLIDSEGKVFEEIEERIPSKNDIMPKIGSVPSNLNVNLPP